MIDGSITLTDPDSTNMTSATIRITGNYQPDGDVLSIDSGDLQGLANDSWDASTGTLTLTGSATKTQYVSMLEHVKYENTSENPSAGDRTVTWTVYDGSDDSDEKQSTITIKHQPKLSGLGDTLTYTENDPATVIDDSITLTDLDSANMASATIQISGNYAPGEDWLSIDSGDLQGLANDSWDASTGTLTLTGSATKAQYMSMLEHVRYENTSEDPSDLDRTVTWIVNDGHQASDGVTSTITVAPVNDAPVLSDLGGTLAYTENDPATVIDGSITLTDVDSANMTSATIRITGNYQPSGDVLSIDAGDLVGGASDSWDPLTGTLTLTGSATKAQYMSMLEHVKYENTGDDPGTADRTVTWTVNDGEDDSVGKESTIQVTVENDPPALSDLDGTLAYTENDEAKVIDGSITLTDPDNLNMTCAEVQITSNYEPGEDRLSIDSGDLLGGATANWDASSGTLTLTGSATKAQYESMLEHVRYENTSDDPHTPDRTVTWTVNDGAADSSPQTSTITVTAVNDAPSLSDLGGILAYTENDPATVIDGSITLTDPDSANIASAEVHITGNYEDGEDRLSIEGSDLLGGVTANWDPSTGTLTLTGSATIPQYESMLEHVKYENTSDNPRTVDRTVTWSVNDGTADSLPQTSTITVTPVNDAPVKENGGLPDTLVDEDAADTVIDLAAYYYDVEDGDALTFEVVGAPDPNLFESVSIQGGLMTIHYAADGHGSTHLTIRGTDHGEGASPAQHLDETFLVTVRPVNDAPTTTNPGLQTAQEDTPLPITGITIDDVDVDETDQPNNSVEVTLSVNHGHITLANPLLVTFTTGDGHEDATMTFSGTLQAVNAAIDSVTYTPEAGFLGEDTLRIVADDQGHTGLGGRLVTRDEIPITVDLGLRETIRASH